MPYSSITKVGNKWCFRNKETGEQFCSDTYEKAVSYMRAKYVHSKDDDEKKRDEE